MDRETIQVILIKLILTFVSSERALAIPTRPVPDGDGGQQTGKHRGADAHRRPRLRDRLLVPRAQPRDRLARN